MANIQNDRQTVVKVEDLLRLKRSELPSDEFWGKFDRELHQRMLRTLVKKDPWYEQVIRGLSGRIAQSSAIAAAAVLVAVLVLRPVLIRTAPAVASVAKATPSVESGAPLAVAMSDLSYADVTSQAIAADYGIDAISGQVSSHDAGFERDFGMDSLQDASYDSISYSADLAHARVPFASARVASLVY